MRLILPGSVFAILLASTPSHADAPAPIPHGQTRAPGASVEPAEAARRMTVPEGFQVEVVAAEPNLVNPVAMTFDERGRIWVTESLEYPRFTAGPGRDRVKVLEDRDGDGTAEAFSIFAEGLNIPSGIAVGHGGVWVANSPDLLFFRDTDGDGKADSREVVVTGFGRADTHELPNALTWGPDGWLYGWNGVFNPSKITYRGKTHEFTCAIFRIHPRTRDFEVFCEGTSNPWGIAWDNDGSAFSSACVIDHLWHLIETGYYHRQGGPYPPYTWKLESIVAHRHEKAAYCGIHFFDSDAYPERYRERLFMGNIHGNAINVDRLERRGATYRGETEPDFLQANDAWFMPVAQKTGPDGSLYILDWYDRYHCYQDARRDPDGIDRLKGRLYRVRYRDTPRAPAFNLADESDERLIERLHSPNVFYRDLAQRILAERDRPATNARLEALALDTRSPRKARMHALWARLGAREPGTDFLLGLMGQADPGFRAWGVRASGNVGHVEPSVRDRVLALAGDDAPEVALQVAIDARKLDGVDAVGVLLDVLSHHGQDPVIPRIVWQNLHPLLEREGQGARFAHGFAALGPRGRAGDGDRSPGHRASARRPTDRYRGGRAPGSTPGVGGRTARPIDGAGRTRRDRRARAERRARRSGTRRDARPARAPGPAARGRSDRRTPGLRGGASVRDLEGRRGPGPAPRRVPVAVRARREAAAGHPGADRVGRSIRDRAGPDARRRPRGRLGRVPGSGAGRSRSAGGPVDRPRRARSILTARSGDSGPGDRASHDARRLEPRAGRRDRRRRRAHRRAERQPDPQAPAEQGPAAGRARQGAVRHRPDRAEPRPREGHRPAADRLAEPLRRPARASRCSRSCAPRVTRFMGRGRTWVPRSPRTAGARSTSSSRTCSIPAS